MCLDVLVRYFCTFSHAWERNVFFADNSYSSWQMKILSIAIVQRLSLNIFDECIRMFLRLKRNFFMWYQISLSLSKVNKKWLEYKFVFFLIGYRWKWVLFQAKNNEKQQRMGWKQNYISLQIAPLLQKWNIKLVSVNDNLAKQRTSFGVVIDDQSIESE